MGSIQSLLQRRGVKVLVTRQRPSAAGPTESPEDTSFGIPVGRSYSATAFPGGALLTIANLCASPGSRAQLARDSWRLMRVTQRSAFPVTRFRNLIGKTSEGRRRRSVGTGRRTKRAERDEDRRGAVGLPSTLFCVGSLILCGAASEPRDQS
jgi:hypothetical protein